MSRNNLPSYLPFKKADKGIASHQVNHKIKLSLLFIFPLLISVCAALFQIDKLTNRASNLANVDELTRLTFEVSHLLHDLQKERGYTGVFISSTGSKFASELINQRKQTRLSITKVNTFLTLKGFTTNTQFEDNLQSLNSHLVELKQIRRQVDRFEISENSAISFYNHLNSKLLAVISSIVQLTVDSELTQAFSAYTFLLKGKERVGIERAKFGIIFSRGYFLLNEYDELLKLEIEQNLFFQEFTRLSSRKLQESLVKLFDEQSFKSVQQIKNSALMSMDADTNVAGWFKVVTHKIDQLNLLGDKVVAELTDNASRLKKDSEAERFYWLATLIIIFVFISFFGLLLIAHIHRTEINRIKEYQSLFSENSAAMIVVDVKTQAITYANKSLADLLKYKQGQLSQLSLADLLRDKSTFHINKFFNATVHSKKFVMEKTLITCRGGSTLYADIFAFPITIGKKQCIALNVVDITNKLHSKKLLQQSALTLQMILDSLNSAVVVFEKENSKPVYMNKEAIKIYQSRGEREPVWALFEQRLDSCFDDNPSEKLITEEHHFNKSKQRCYQITNNLIDWNDGRTVCLKMLKDITKACETEKRNENLLAENRQLLCRNYLLIEQERKHIAKELHDELGQLLTGIKLQADYINRQVGNEHESLHGASKSIIQATSQLIRSTRDITNNLRPIIIDELGLIDAIKELIAIWRNMNKNIEFEFSAEDLPHALTDDIKISIYRIVQEGITNACKHADASHIKIEMKFIPSPYKQACFLLQLQIQDDGQGFEQTMVPNLGMGVINMRERTEALNGSFCLVNRLDKGAEVLITIPLDDVLVGSGIQEILCH